MLIDLKQVISKYNLDIQRVIHLGASEGQERDIYSDLNVAVIWVEAMQETFEKLYKNICSLPNQYAVNACIGINDGESKIFHVSNNQQSSSYLQLGTHKTAHPEVHYIKDVEMVTIRVDTLIEELQNNWSDAPFLINEKCALVADLQGAEMDALISCGNLLEKFGLVYLEVNTKPVYEGCALKNEIETYLEEEGFEGCEEFIYNHWGWGDEVFINKKLLTNVYR